MKKILKIFWLFGILFLLSAEIAVAQETAVATARPITPSLGRPSTLQIKQNILKMKQAAIQRDIAVVQRCLSNNSMSQVLRDPQGNVNFVPQLDLVNCNRKLRQLLDQLNALARESEQLAKDAQAQAMAFERRERAQRAKARILGGSE